MSDYEDKVNNQHMEDHRGMMGEPLSRQMTVAITPEQYERLFFQPTPARGDLAKRLGNPTLLGLLGFLIPYQATIFCLLGWQNTGLTCEYLRTHQYVQKLIELQQLLSLSLVPTSSLVELPWFSLVSLSSFLETVSNMSLKYMAMSRRLIPYQLSLWLSSLSTAHTGSTWDTIKVSPPTSPLLLAKLVL